MYLRGFPDSSDGEEWTCNAGDLGSGPGLGRWEKGRGTHSSLLTWEVAWTEEHGGLQSVGSQSWARLSDLTL